MLRLWLAATTVVAMMTGVAVAQTSSSIGATGPQQPGVGEPIMVTSGSAVVTGYSGPMTTATVPGAGGQDLPMYYTEDLGPMATTIVPGSGSQDPRTYDGNAARLIVPGQPPKLVSTPE